MKPPKLTIIETPSEIVRLTEKLKSYKLLTYDTETTGVLKDSEIIGYSICASEEEAYYIILAKWDKENKTLIYYPENRAPTISLLKSIAAKDLVMHNGIFDIDKTMQNFQVSLLPGFHTDTMILAHLLDENRSVGLKELGAELLGESAKEEQELMKASIIANGGSATKTKYELYKADANLIAKYGAKDAWLTYILYQKLVLELYDQGLQDFFYKEESMPLLKGPTYELNTVGIKTDLNEVVSVEKLLQSECILLKSFVNSEIEHYIKDKYPGTNKKNTFNIGSPSQLSWLCFEVLQLPFSELTKEGKVVAKYLLNKLPYSISDKRAFIRACKSACGQVYVSKVDTTKGKVKEKKIKDPWTYMKCGKEELEAFRLEYRWIAKFLEYKQKDKILNTYVSGIKDKVQYGILYPSFLQHGTTSGRYSSKNINFQNLPRKDKRIKSCMIARPGRVFVGLDYSQLEPRVFAYMSNDPNLLEAFKNGSDFYSVIGTRVYKKFDTVPLKEGPEDAFGVKYPDLRDRSKVIALATVYGSLASKLMKTTKKSKEETQADMDEYLSEFPGVKDFMAESHMLAKKYGWVSNAFGRKRRMPEAMNIPKIYGKKEHKELPYEARKLLNLATNHRVQSTAASIVNRAMIAYYDNIRLAGIFNAPIVTQVHDSIIVECDEKDAETVSILLQDAAENTIDLGTVSLEALPKIGKNFAEV